MNQAAMSAHTSLLLFRARGIPRTQFVRFCFKPNVRFMSAEKLVEMRDAIKRVAGTGGLPELTKDHLKMIDGFLEDLKSGKQSGDLVESEVDKSFFEWGPMNTLIYSLRRACENAEIDQETRESLGGVNRLLNEIYATLRHPLRMSCQGRVPRSRLNM